MTQSSTVSVATTTHLIKRLAIAIWCWLSRGVNHPMIAAPSEWLVRQLLARGYTPTEVRDCIWSRAKSALKLRYPGLERPLGSCFYPGVANIMDIAFWYGHDAQKVLTRLAHYAAIRSNAERTLWHEDCDGKLIAPQFSRRINYTSELVHCLASAVRDGRAPSYRKLSVCALMPEFNLEAWEAKNAEIRAKFPAMAAAELLIKEAKYCRGPWEFCPKIVLSQTIDGDFLVGGNYCRHFDDSGRENLSIMHNGKQEWIEDPPTATRSQGNPMHLGCPDGLGTVRVTGATYVVTIATRNPMCPSWVSDVTITPSTKPEDILKYRKKESAVQVA